LRASSRADRSPVGSRTDSNAISNIVRKWLVCLLLPALLGQATAALGAVPTQFIAKMYSEALGRAPDPIGLAERAAVFSNERL
jgi:hypothetical protein